MSETYEDVLMHHGILGQKWGVRRYQNADGSLTAAGKRRYQTGPGVKKAYKKTKDFVKSEINSHMSLRKKTTARKNAEIRALSDDELRARTARLRLQNDYLKANNEYIKLITPEKRKSIVGKAAESLIRGIGKATESVVTDVFKQIGKKAVKSVFNESEDTTEEDKNKKSKSKSKSKSKAQSNSYWNNWGTGYDDVIYLPPPRKNKKRRNNK